MRGIRIGIPRALYYFTHPGLWEAFFQGLGAETVLSEPTTQRTMERAGLISEAEHCLPAKMLDAHLAEIADTVDMVFVPRILSTHRGHISCPKLAALPDAARADLAGTAEVLTIDLDEERRPLLESLVSLGRELGANRGAARSAARHAIGVMRATRRTGPRYARPRDSPGILILGHPYNLGDEFISGPILRKLEHLNAGIDLISFPDDDIPPSFIQWDTSNRMYHVLSTLEPGEVSGVIQISSFNCGCDSMMAEFFRAILQEKSVPYMMLVVDEHAAQGGIDTRLEAFVDSLSW